MAPKPDDLETRARAGDAAAQYRLAGAMAARGDQASARNWLTKAAARNHPDAIFTLSAAMLTGAGGEPREPAAGLAGVRRAAALGSTHAMRMLAALVASGAEGARDWEGALDLLQRAVDRFDPAGFRETAMLLFMLDPDDADGAALAAAAAPNDGLAAALVVRRAMLGRAGASREIAEAALAALRRAGHPLAKAYEPARFASPSAATPACDIERAFARLREFRVQTAFQPEHLSARPRIAVTRSAYSPEACDYLIGAAAPRLQPAEIAGDKGEARLHSHRTAWSAAFYPGSADLPMVKMVERLAAIAGLDPARAEPLSILRYRPGEEYRPHHDFLGPEEEDLARGQRIRTALIWLNDDYDGGETHFPSADIKVRGAPGDAIVFDNVDEHGAPEVSARHAGLAVVHGEKWLASVWFRDRPFIA